MTRVYDFVVIGAGIYGLYAAGIASDKGRSVLVLDCDDRPFSRASYINQARVHNGYHYPRSYSTAIKSARYFDRFCKDFDFAINKRFRKIYAISSKYSLTSGDQFVKFCQHAGIPCDEINPDRYFRKNLVQAAFETLEYSFDAGKICQHLEGRLKDSGGRADLSYGTWIVDVSKDGNEYVLRLNNGTTVRAGHVLNCTYASLNQVNRLFGFDQFKIKYEIAEVIECNVGKTLQDVGITVMDGPFFSVMPFGDSGLHTLTAVTFTPHKTCYNNLPQFDCQKVNTGCTPGMLCNCNSCQARPATAFEYMKQMAVKYLNGPAEIAYRGSLYAIKPILLASEIDDSRPTLIRSFSQEPGYTAILSGKINTVYDMENVIA